MEIPIHRDGNGQPYVEWSQERRGYKRAWIRHPTDPDNDWAGVGRYLNVVRVEEPHTGPAGNSTDFPISSNLDDEQILVAFVTAVTSITGGVLEFY
ncbi:MAG: hypothetical protein OXU75_04965 [Deltaproteobacteria bacterium]|nr:hypothetical protein [Deltaproteobacteria bacterium]